jgi:hypothetical protein
MSFATAQSLNGVQQNAPRMTSAVLTAAITTPKFGAKNLIFPNSDNCFPGIKNWKPVN